MIGKTPHLINQEQEEDKIWHVTLLHFALSGGHKPIVEMLTKKNASVRPYSSLLLDIPSRRKRLDLVRMLLRVGADASTVPPYSVVLSDSSEMLESFIGEGLNINTQNDSWPILVYVCRGDKGEHPERFKRLLDFGVDVNFRGKHNLTVLHVATRAGFNKDIEVLLAFGTDITVRNDAGETPLELAKKAHRFKTVDLLQANGG